MCVLKGVEGHDEGYTFSFFHGREGGLGLMIEEEEKEGGGGVLARPKFVPTLTQLHRGLKIGKMVQFCRSSFF